MEFLCVRCDERFEAEDGDKPRCPKCLRVHGIQPVDAGGGGSRPWLWPAALLLVAGVAAAIYLGTGKPGTPPGEVAGEPLATDELGDRLAAMGVEAGPLSRLLVADDKVEKFARSAVGATTDPLEQAHALMAHVRKRASALAFVPWALLDAPKRPIEVAAAVLGRVQEDAARHNLFPLEVAALSVAALRSVGAEAMLAEVFAFDGVRAPPDPSGQFGYYVVAMRTAPDAPPVMFDVYGGRTSPIPPDGFTLLTDLEAVGVALAHRSMHRLGREHDPSSAMTDADAAVKLTPSSPSVRGARAAVMLASGGTEPGSQELEAAAQLRADAPRRSNLAMLYLASGDGERAAREVALALEEAPDYASGHVTLATVHLSRMDHDQARVALDKAQQLEPDLPTLPMAWAQYHAVMGETDQAIARAQEGVRVRPDNPQTHLMLARMYRQATRFDDMRRSAQKVLELSPSSQATQIRKLIGSVLGPTALEAPGDEVLEGDDGDGTPDGIPDGDFDLSKGSKILGGGDDGTGTTLFDRPSEGGGLKLGDEGPKLRLGGGSGSKLRLR